MIVGDLGELDSEGRIKYLSRLKDMLKVGGENIAALEIESLLCGHPAVGVAAVTEAELIGFCSEAIASFKVPRAVRFVTEWPMSATKIQKFRLREMLEDTGRAPAP